MWTAAGPIIRQNTAETDYKIDMTGGESGGPVWQAGTYYVTAVNAYGVTSSTGAPLYAAGPSLTAARQTNIHNWVR
jgi:V8-like Glu-specific endopeptidase